MFILMEVFIDIFSFIYVFSEVEKKYFYRDIVVGGGV